MELRRLIRSEFVFARDWPGTHRLRRITGKGCDSMLEMSRRIAFVLSVERLALDATNDAASMSAPQNTIAIVYDYDQTLSPNYMQDEVLFPVFGIDAKKFWSRCHALVKEQGYDNELAT
jgi:hypothetical protein